MRSVVHVTIVEVMATLLASAPLLPRMRKGAKGGKGGGKGGKGGGKGKFGKAGKAATPKTPVKWCPKCQKPHSPDTCWVTHPHLKPKKKVQSVEEQDVECNFIDLGALDLETECTMCATDFVPTMVCYPPGLKGTGTDTMISDRFKESRPPVGAEATTVIPVATVTGSSDGVLPVRSEGGALPVLATKIPAEYVECAGTEKIMASGRFQEFRPPAGTMENLEKRTSTHDSTIVFVNPQALPTSRTPTLTPTPTPTTTMTTTNTLPIPKDNMLEKILEKLNTTTFSKDKKDTKVLGVEVWSMERVKSELARLKEEKAERDETRLGDVLPLRGSPWWGNAAPGPGSPEVKKASPQMQTGGKVAEKKAANLDGPKSSHPLVVGESGRPMANPPLQMQTVEGPGNRRNT